ncbi:MAG: acetate--CoA ligase family protein [Deltaproteobacteria bacterium]|nr:acetate--CoA ligase family protein [Deltaproteobacteria bacterium]
MEFVEKAIKEGRSTLSEYESKQVLAKYSIPITKEVVVDTKEDVVKAAQQVGYPLVMKGSSAELAHKTEKGLIKVDIRNDEEALKTFDEFMANMSDIKDPAVLVQEMVKGQRELVVGMTRDPQFGPCVMFGLGGIFTEILRDVSFRKAPLEKRDALEMMREIKGQKILDAVRGMEAADIEVLANILINVGQIGIENDNIKEIDINPIILSQGKPIAVDALVVVG